MRSELPSVLLVGGSGNLGRKLTKLLAEKNYKVRWLTRKLNSKINIKQFEWDFEKAFIDTACFEKTDILINLAGASIRDKRWTKHYKNEIYNSRVLATRFLREVIECNKYRIRTFIQGSAVGYYGNQTTSDMMAEDHFPGKDFLAKTCEEWELEAKKFSELGCRVCIMRTGVVFSPGNEAYDTMLKLAAFKIGSTLGDGRQYFPWIHLEDWCRMVIFLIEDQLLRGAFNAVAPHQIKQAELNTFFHKKTGKKQMIHSTPAWFTKLLFGEMAENLLNGSSISAQKILNAGFKYKYPDLNSMLK